MKIAGMSMLGFVGLIIALLVVVLLILGVVALVKYIAKK